MSFSAGSGGPAREPEPDGGDAEGIEQAGAVGDELACDEEPQRGAESAGGVEDKSGVSAGAAGESGMVVPQRAQRSSAATRDKASPCAGHRRTPRSRAIRHERRRRSWSRSLVETSRWQAAVDTAPTQLKPGQCVRSGNVAQG